MSADAFLSAAAHTSRMRRRSKPMPAGDFFGDLMNAPEKYVVSRTAEGTDVAQHVRSFATTWSRRSAR
jgi:hypothetical protein